MIYTRLKAVHYIFNTNDMRISIIMHTLTKKHNTLIVPSILLIFISILSPVNVYAESTSSQSANMPAMEVGVITLHKQVVPRTVTIPGRAIAYQQAAIRPRVDGVIQSIMYKQGSVVKKNDPLFQLDDAIYQAQVASDQANVATADANLIVAQAEYKRAEGLEGSGYTQAEVEQARASLANAKATLSAAKAALVYSKTQLSWTTILSPITGVTEVATISVGDLVVNGQTDELTTVTTLDPIDVDMLETSARILAFRSQIKNGTLKLNDKIKAKLTLENGEIYEATGELIAPGNIVSTSTGTVPLRFRFENPERSILPGMFLRGEVEVGGIQAFLVPQRAAQRQSNGRLSAYRVGDDGTAQQIQFYDQGTFNNNWVVTEGIEAGSQIIVDGLKSMRIGTHVKPIAATISKQGLVTDSSTANKGQ
jgi:membrane fusion protein (multidrug efflux system)